VQMKEPLFPPLNAQSPILRMGSAAVACKVISTCNIIGYAAVYKPRPTHLRISYWRHFLQLG
jgi:hypothetical protein